MKKYFFSGILVSLLSLVIGSFAFQPILQTKAADTSVNTEQNNIQIDADLLEKIKTLLVSNFQSSLENKNVTIDLQTGKILGVSSKNASTTSSQITDVSSTITNEASSQATSSQMIFPTIGKISKGFGGNHYAIDIDNPNEPNVWAADNGRVIKVFSDCIEGSFGCGGGYGNHVVIDHGNGVQTLYAHLSSVSVKTGDQVHKGDILGKMGKSGNVPHKNIHLHFEVRKDGIMENPQKYIMPN